jgi:hypothetical protein
MTFKQGLNATRERKFGLRHGEQRGVIKLRKNFEPACICAISGGFGVVKPECKTHTRNVRMLPLHQ